MCPYQKVSRVYLRGVFLSAAAPPCVMSPVACKLYSWCLAWYRPLDSAWVYLRRLGAGLIPLRN